MTVEALVARVLDERDRWDALTAGVSDGDWTEPGLCGAWSLRDVVAHVSWFERQMVELLVTRRLEGSELWLLPPHERNAAIHRENVDRSVEDVRRESATLRGELVENLRTLREHELLDPACFPPMPPDWQPLDILAQNTYEHYAAHAASLRRWMTDRGAGVDS